MSEDDVGVSGPVPKERRRETTLEALGEVLRLPAWGVRTDARAHRGTLHLIAIAVILGLALGTSLVFLSNTAAGPDWARESVPLDDTWIHLVYAQNLADHGAFYYNVGQPEAGMSSPLWAALLAVPLFFGAGPVASAQGLSVVTGLFVPVLAYALGRRVGLSWGVSLGVGVLVAVEPNLAYARVSGMEVGLAASLALLAAIFVMDENHWAAGVTFGLMAVTRGELSVVAGVMIGAVLLREYLRRETLVALTRSEAVLAAKLVLPPLLLGGAWSLFNLSVSGRLLPNTYYVKHDFSLGLLNAENIRNMWPGYFEHVGFTGGPHAFPLWVLVLLGVFALARAYGHRGFAVGIVPLVIVYATSIAVRVGPEYWTFSAKRYLDIALPFVALLAAAGAVFAWKWAARAGVRWLTLAMPLALAAVTAFAVAGVVQRFPEVADEYSWNSRNIGEVNVAMGERLARDLPADTLVGVTDAGAMKYLSGLEVVDMLGLNEHRAIGRPPEEVMADFRPGYVVLFRSEWSDGLPYVREMASYATERNTILGGAELVLYEVDEAKLPTLEQYYESLQ